MSRKFKIILLAAMIISVSMTQIPSASTSTNQTTVDFLWGFKFEGQASTDRLDLSTTATDIVKKAFGSGYSASVYIEAELTYNFSFGLHTPYKASMHLSNINPRVEQSVTGYISLTPENTYFNIHASTKLDLKVGAMIFLYGIKILGGEYVFDEIDFSFDTTLDTGHLSPLGTYRVSIGDLIESTVGKILPKIELVIGLVAGAVFAIPLDWDLELVFQSYVDAASGTNQILWVSPSTLTFDKQGSLPFTITPLAGGQESLRWSFSQRISMGLDFYIRSKMMADIALGVAISYESPEVSMKVLSSGLSTLPAQTLSNALDADLAVPLPQLEASLTSIDSSIENTTLGILVNDEATNAISGAKVEIETRKGSYSATDLGNGYYSVTTPTSELSSVQISAEKYGYKQITTTADIGTKYLQEYGSLMTDYDSLVIDYEDLKSKPTDTTQIMSSPTLNYILASTTAVFIITTAYFAIRKPKAKPT